MNWTDLEHLDEIILAIAGTIGTIITAFYGLKALIKRKGKNENTKKK